MLKIFIDEDGVMTWRGHLRPFCCIGKFKLVGIWIKRKEDGWKNQEYEVERKTALALDIRLVEWKKVND